MLSKFKRSTKEVKTELQSVRLLHHKGIMVGLSVMILYVINIPTTIAQRKVVLLDHDWKFTRSDNPASGLKTFNDSGWQTVSVPHDWAISGPFDMHNDAQTVMVTEDGDKRPALRTGRTGSLPWVGTGWYRKHLNVPLSSKGGRCMIEFDGAMSHAEVYLNGNKIGSWPYGYASFSFDITDKIRFGKDNLLAVRLENLEESSRWYPGAGLYREVRLVYSNAIHVDHWGTFITTPSVKNDRARLTIKTVIKNENIAAVIKLQTTIYDPKGKQVASVDNVINVKNTATALQDIDLKAPLLWDIKKPFLYKAISKLIWKGSVVDSYETTFGIRTIAFTSDKGFILNGRQVKINGVCNHHDLGPLGAAVNYRAIQRQLELLKAMGCNAIRTSHNPPDPKLLDLCDKMGFLVMDEAFDEWKIPKCKNGYNLLFDEWAEKDLTAMIHRDRNHPSVILWSVGNEVPEQRSTTGAETAKFLVGVAHREDNTRLTTAGFNSHADAIKNGLADAVDVVGLNYKPDDFVKVHREHPTWKLLGSETESAISSRGEYMFPVAERKGVKYPNKQISSYDLDAPTWGNAPDLEFAMQGSESYVAGQFVWTGFDYLGEPTPYNNDYPSHSSYFGIIDLAGIPKDRYYLYQSNWTDAKVLHLLPHWTWPERQGEITPVHCYTSYSSAELFLNGKSQGVRTKDPLKKYGRYRLSWDSVRYQPGELKIVGLDDHLKPVATEIKRTAGTPSEIVLKADRKRIIANGKDLCFITVNVIDQNGIQNPRADNNIKFTIKGVGKIEGVCNGDATSTQILTGSEIQLYNGACVVVVKSLKTAGTIEITASGRNLKSGFVFLDSQ